MNPLRPVFHSERVRVTPPLSADKLRYDYLNLQNAEPNLGVPNPNTLYTIDNFVLVSDLTGKRFFVPTVTWDSTYTTLYQNSATWLRAVEANTLYFKASGGTIQGNLDVTGDSLFAGNMTVIGVLCALSAFFGTTQQTVVSSLSVIAKGFGPALLVGVSEGNFQLASFKDLDNNKEIMVVEDAAYSTPFGLRGRVGINVGQPNVDLTVAGEISAREVIYTPLFQSPGGTSNQWNAAYTDFNFNSANYLNLQAASATDITFKSVSAREFIFISTTGKLISGGRDLADLLDLNPGLDIRGLVQYLSSNALLLSAVTITNGLSVTGGLSADRIYGVLQNVGNFPVDNFVGDDSTVTFNLGQDISSANDILVYISGIYQDKLTFSINPGPPSTITFVEPPPSPDTPGEANIEVVFIKANPLPIGIVADGSITTPKYANYSLTKEKAAPGNFITSDKGGTIFNNLSVTGSISASQFFLTNAILQVQSFNVQPGQTTFELASAVATPNDILVFVSGVYQRKDTYALPNNNTLVFIEAPPAGLNVVEVQYLRYFPYTTFIPAPGSVLNNTIASNAITIGKLSGVFITQPPISFQADGLTTQFQLLCAAFSSSDIDVYFSGVYQNKSSFAIPDNRTLTFYEAPPSGASIEVTYRQVQFYNTNQNILDNSVTTPKIADLAVTSEKLAPNINVLNNIAAGGTLDITGRTVLRDHVEMNRDLVVYGSLTALGDFTVIDTILTTTSALSVINNGSGPALVVRQGGPEAIAEFFDRESGVTLFVGNDTRVGVNTRNPRRELEVVGTLSATNIAAVQTLSGRRLEAEFAIVSAGIDLADRVGDVVISYRNFHGIHQSALRYTAVNPFSATWNLRTNQVANLYLSAGGNTLLVNPSGQAPGGTYMLLVRTLSGNVQLFFDTLYRFPDNITPTLTQAPSSMDIFTFVSDGQYMYGTAVQNYSWV